MWAFLASALTTVLAPPESASQFVWQWHGKYDGCVLRQKLDEAGSFLDVGRTAGADITSISLTDRRGISKAWKPLKGVMVTMEPGGTVRSNGYLGPAEEPGSRIVLLEMLDGHFMDEFSQASSLILSHKNVGNVRIALRSPRDAIQALRKCEDRKMREYGIDPIAWRALPTKPMPTTSPPNWLSYNDYPIRERAYLNDALVIARLDVGPEGTVLGCMVVNRQAATEFKDATCRALRRNAQFRPARDAQGKGIPAPYIVRVRFVAIR